MFEHFDDRARRCVVLGQHEARRLGHEELGTVHLLLGVAAVDEGLLGVQIEAVRAAVVALHGSGAPRDNTDALPISAEAKDALEGANAQALQRGHTVIDHAHLLLALLDGAGGASRALREAGATPGAVRERAGEAAGADPQRTSPPRVYHSWKPSERVADHARVLREGHALPVTIGADTLGDLGHPHVDAALLELMLAVDTPAAHLLRAHGIDDVHVRASLLSPETSEAPKPGALTD